MRLYEYEGKEIFKKCGIPVPQGSVVKAAEEARRTASEIGKEVAVKAQILGGRRGKGGGIKFARTPDEAGKIAQGILGMELEGYKVNSLLIEEKLNITNELYMGITVDGENGAPVAMVSAEGEWK